MRAKNNLCLIQPGKPQIRITNALGETVQESTYNLNALHAKDASKPNTSFHYGLDGSSGHTALWGDGAECAVPEGNWKPAPENHKSIGAGSVSRPCPGRESAHIQQYGIHARGQIVGVRGRKTESGLLCMWTTWGQHQPYRLCGPRKGGYEYTCRDRSAKPQTATATLVQSATVRKSVSQNRPLGYTRDLPV